MKKDFYVRQVLEKAERRIEEIKQNSNSVCGFVNNYDLEEYKVVTNLKEIAEAVTTTRTMLSIIEQCYNEKAIMAWLNETIC